MTKQQAVAPINIFEQISQVCREFRKQITQGKSPRIEKFLTRVPDDARENLFSNLLEIEVNYRHRKGDDPATDEYIKRFPPFAKQIRRAFFEPTQASMDERSSSDENQIAELQRSPGKADSLSPTLDLPNANRLGDYELIRELGRGGMGIVYEARHTKTENRVALKTLPTGVDGQQVNADRLYRFRREFRSLSEINHRNLVGMQTLEVDGSQWFFTMDLIEGEDFLSYVRPRDELDEVRLRASLSQLAQGVIALHQRGIIHRDLKPSNVLVSSDGRVTILDFGLASELQKATELTETRSGMFAGTPRYAAPEQMFGERTEASDWYAFGTMLYEALTGEPPFHGANQIALLRQKQENDPPQLSEQRDLPVDMAELADGLVRREPSERQTAEAIGERLKLDQETRSGGSTQGSHGSTGSVDEEDDRLVDSHDEETILIGRDEQLEQLEAVRQEFLEMRRPQVVWITGLSGEGKSSLAEKFLRPLRAGSEFLVLAGRCYDRESVPFKVIDSLIDPLVRFLRSRSAGDLANILPPDVAALAQLFPLLRRVKAISGSDTKQLAGLDDKQIHRLAFVALEDLLHNISRHHAIVVFIDDLQWGDADSAEEIFKLLASANSPAVLLLGSCRRDEMDASPFLAVWENELVEQPHRVAQRTVEVQPLTTKQAVELISQRVGVPTHVIEKEAVELIADTQGNPYFLEQLIEGFDAATGSFRAIPLNEIITTKLERLPPNAAPLLNAIAVAGKSVSLFEASQVCGFEQPALGTVSHMRSERLVRIVGSGEQQSVDTYHDKIRETLISGLGEQQRRDLHQAYGEWIEQQAFHSVASSTEQNVGAESVSATKWHPRAPDLAFHFVQADVSGKAFRYSLEAGRQSMTAFAFSDALGFLNQARALEPQDVDGTDRFALRFLTGKAYSGVDRFDECIEYLQQATSLAENTADRSAAFFTMAEARYRKSDYQTSVEDYHRAFAELGERLPKSTPGKLGRALSSAVSIHLVPRGVSRLVQHRSEEDSVAVARIYPRFSQMVSHLDMFGYLDSSVRVCALAKTLDDPIEKHQAYNTYAVLLAISGVPGLSGYMWRVSHRFAIGAPLMSSLGPLHYHEGVFAYFRGELDRAESDLLQAENLFDKVDDYRLNVALHFLRHLWSIRGDSSKIEEYGRKEFELAKRSNDEITMAYGNYGLADAYSRQGEFQRGVLHAQAAVDVLEKWNATFKCIAYQELGRTQLQASDYPAARATLRHAVGLVFRFRFFEISVPSFSLLAEAVLGSNWIVNSESLSRKDRNSAQRMARIARWTGWLFPNNLPHAHRVSARHAVAKGKKRKAMKYFDKALAAAQKVGADYEGARARIDKSMLDYPNSKWDREQGLALLESLGCVLPDAEVEYLNIERDAHHARAATARAQHDSDSDKLR
jgi:serine/threonine protein kinase/tetratricopeptide (TPR) repeat protein